MPDPIEKLRKTIESLVADEVAAESRYERAVRLTNEAGFPEIAVGLRQIMKDMRRHRDALEFMLLGLKPEENRVRSDE